ncbi:MAG: rRNA pseudouridine synthase [Paludibacter sp.]|nr:rRNA pseudouridine synthase [Paludibacter sp.]
MNTEHNQENPQRRPYKQNTDSRREGNNQYPKRNNFQQGEGNYKPRNNFNKQGNNSGTFQPRNNFNKQGNNSSTFQPRNNFNRQGNNLGTFQPHNNFNNNQQRDIPDDYGNRWDSKNEVKQRSYNNDYPHRPSGNSNRQRQSPYSQQRNTNYQQPQYYQPPQYSGKSEGNFVETRFDNRGENVRFRKPLRNKTANKSNNQKPVQYQQEYIDPTQPVRLNKFLANSGICSRREADEYIQAGVISVNGEVVTTLGTKIMPVDQVKFHNQPVLSERKVYILLNKPKNCVTTTEDPNATKNVMDIVRDACSERIYPVGRLDRNTTGVLLLTNDGDLASKLAHPKFDKKKVYQVTLDKPLLPDDFRTIMLGVELNDGIIAADALEYAHIEKKNVIGIEIHSGKNRIVRRMFEQLGYKVRSLDRVMFAGLTKKNLQRGKFRYLSEQEVAFLKMGNF